MIRHVVIVSWKPGTKASDIAAITAATQSMRVPGLVSLTLGEDLKLRDGTGDFAIVCDFEDEAAYRAYDTNEEHLRISREVVFPHVERAIRCEFRI